MLRSSNMGTGAGKRCHIHTFVACFPTPSVQPSQTGGVQTQTEALSEFWGVQRQQHQTDPSWVVPLQDHRLPGEKPISILRTQHWQCCFIDNITFFFVHLRSYCVNIYPYIVRVLAHLLQLALNNDAPAQHFPEPIIVDYLLRCVLTLCRQSLEIGNPMCLVLFKSKSCYCCTVRRCSGKTDGVATSSVWSLKLGFKVSTATAAAMLTQEANKFTSSSSRCSPAVSPMSFTWLMTLTSCHKNVTLTEIDKGFEENFGQKVLTDLVKNVSEIHIFAFFPRATRKHISTSRLCINELEEILAWLSIKKQEGNGLIAFFKVKQYAYQHKIKIIITLYLIYYNMYNKNLLGAWLLFSKRHLYIYVHLPIKAQIVVPTFLFL